VDREELSRAVDPPSFWIAGCEVAVDLTVWILGDLLKEPLVVSCSKMLKVSQGAGFSSTSCQLLRNDV
jgi:hypothetical protein